MLKHIKLLCFFMLVNASVSYGMGVVVTDDFKAQTVGKGLAFLEDPTSELSIDNLPSLSEWPTSNRDALNLGFTRSSYWGHFALQNQSTVAQTLLIEFSYPLLDTIDAYLVRDGQRQAFRIGESQPFSQRLIAHSNLLIPIEIAANSNSNIIFKIKTDSTMQIPITVWSKDHYIETNHRISSYLGLFYGVLIAISIYHLLIFASLRDNNLLYYSLFNFSMLGVFLCLKGIPTAFLWPDSVGLTDKALIISLCAGVCFSSLFTLEILAIKQSHARISKYLLGVSAAACLLALLGLVVPYYYMIQTVMSFIGISLIINIAAQVKRFRDGYPPAKYVLVAGIFSITGIFITLFEKSGVLPHSPWFEGAAYAGVLIMMMVYAFALSYQINMDRALKDQMQRRLLATQAKLNTDLDQRIIERTHEKEKMSLLLQTTKALANSEDKFHATKITLRHLKKILSGLTLQSASLYIANKDSSTLTHYPLWLDHVELKTLIAQEADPDHLDLLLGLNRVSLIEDLIIIPIRSEKISQGFLTISSYYSEDNALDFGLIENMAQSLAQAMERIDSEENSRLASIGAMAAAIVHDLKNPIGAIKGCAELATHTKSEEERKDYLHTIIEETSRMSVMAHEVLDVSKNKIQLSVSPVPIQDFIADISKLLTRTFNAQNITFESHCDLEGTIYLDSERVRRSLLNLATNARDALSSSQTNKPKCILLVTEENNSLIISITDNGPGIPNAIKAVLFEPFVTHGKPNGTGLGMAIVKKTMDAHQGDISFTSNSSGTSFRLVFPNALKETEKSNVKPLLSALATLQQHNVLVVEDNPVNRKVLRKTLQSLELSVDTATNGAEAVQKAADNSYSFILMDIEMPIMNGIQACAILRQNPQYQSTPIIALTGHSLASQEHLRNESDFTAILSKPVSRDQLAHSLLQAINGQSSDSQIHAV